MENIQALSAALDKYTADTTAKVADAMDQFHELQDSFDRIEARLNRGGGNGSRASIPGDLRAEYQAISVFARKGDETDIRAMAVSDDPAGGYFVHPALSDTMTKRLFDLSPMRRLVRVVQIGDGSGFEEPLDLDETGSVWVGEEEDRTPTAAPKVGMIHIELNESYALQVITQRLLDDAGIDLGAWVMDKISDKFTRSEGAAMVVGDGFKKPKGFLAYDTDLAADFTRPKGKIQKIMSGAASSVTSDALKNTFWALRAAHREDATWVMSSATANLIDRLKDGNGDYLWRSSMTAGAPNELLGKPVAFAEDMPSATTPGAHPIAFGDWKRGYTAIERPGMRFLRDPYTAKPSVVFYAYRRFGGGVSLTDAIKVMEIGESA